MQTKALAPAVKRARVLTWVAVAVAALNVPIQFWEHANEGSPWVRSSGLAALSLCLSMIFLALGTRMESGWAKRGVVTLQWVAALAMCVIVFSRLLRH